MHKLMCRPNKLTFLAKRFLYQYMSFLLVFICNDRVLAQCRCSYTEAVLITCLVKKLPCGCVSAAGKCAAVSLRQFMPISIGCFCSRVETTSLYHSLYAAVRQTLSDDALSSLSSHACWPQVMKKEIKCGTTGLSEG